MVVMRHQGVLTGQYGKNSLNQHGEGNIIGILRRALSRVASSRLLRMTEVKMKLTRHLFLSARASETYRAIFNCPAEAGQDFRWVSHSYSALAGKLEIKRLYPFFVSPLFEEGFSFLLTRHLFLSAQAHFGNVPGYFQYRSLNDFLNHDDQQSCMENGQHRLCRPSGARFHMHSFPPLARWAQ